jgi:hypothetical protein
LAAAIVSLALGDRLEAAAIGSCSRSTPSVYDRVASRRAMEALPSSMFRVRQ